MEETSNIDYSDILQALDLTKILHFGSIVYIETSTDNQNSQNLLYGDGFIMKSINLLNNSGKSLEDLSGSLFKIVPPYAFLVQKEIYNEFEQWKENFNNMKKTRTEYQELLNELDNEIAFNSKVYNKSKGFPLNFGDSIQFEHIKSQKFLSYQPDQISGGTSSFNISDTFSVELQDHPSEFTHFKLYPCYRHQNERIKLIQFEDEVYIAASFESFSRESYLSVQKKTERKEEDIQEDLEENENGEKTIDKGLQCDLTISYEHNTRFRLRFYSAFYHQNTNKLLYGNIFWISHIEKNSYLEYYEKGKLDGETGFENRVSQIQGKNINYEDQANRNIEKHIEVLRDRSKLLFFEEFPNNQLKHTVGMWKLESEDRLKGGYLTWDGKIRLRNLSSGLYLSIKPITKGEISYELRIRNYILTLEKRITDDSLFMLKSGENSKMEGAFISNDSFFYLLHCKTGLEVGLDQENFIKTGDLKDRILWRLTLQSKSTQENALKMMKTDPQEIWETRFLLSCLPIIKTAINLIEIMNKEIRQSNLYNLTFVRKNKLDLLKECLESVMNFCYHDTKNYTAFTDLTLEFTIRKPNSYRQKILREQGFIQLLSHLITAAFPDEYSLKKIIAISEEKKKIEKMFLNRNLTSKLVARKSFWTAAKKSGEEKEREIFEIYIEISTICFDLLSNICNDNYENQLEFFKYFKKLRRALGFGLGAARCLISVFSKNEKLLHLLHISTEFRDISDFSNIFSFNKKNPESMVFINDKRNAVINSFMVIYEKLLSKKLSYEFWNENFEFLSAICTCNDRGVNVNQMLISEVILQNQRLKSKFLINLEYVKSGNKLLISMQQNQKQIQYELVEFFQTVTDSNTYELRAATQYLKREMQLLSNLCSGRNYVNIKIIKKTFKMPVLMEYIWSPGLPEDIRAIFVSLLLHLHIDIKPRTERIVPLLSKNFVRDDLKKLENTKTNNYLDLHNVLGNQKTINNDESKNIARKARQKVYDVVIDINRIKNVTGNLRQTQSKADPSSKTEIELESIGSQDKEKNTFDDINPEILFDIFKDDELINEEQIKAIMDKILEYLEVEIKTTTGPQLVHNSNKKDPYINFNKLTLNLVAMVKKMVFFECFDQEKTNPIKKKKFKSRGILSSGKETAMIIHNDFNRLVRALIFILKVQKKSEFVEEIKKKSSASTRLKSMVGVQMNMNINNNISASLKQLLSKDIKKKNYLKTGNDTSKTVDDFNTILAASIKKKFIRNLDESKDKLESDQDLDIKIKIEIINILIFMMDIRHDDCINQIINFIKNSVSELFPTQSNYNEALIQKAIRMNLVSYLPGIFENGFGKLNQNNNGIQFNHDFDRITEKPLLPLLLYIFQNTNDYDLNYLVLNLIFKMFEQRRRIIKSIKKVQLIIQDYDQMLFDYLRHKSLHLRFIAEQSEIWLVSPQELENPQFKYKFVIYQVKDIIKELISFFYGSLSISENQAANNFFINEQHLNLVDEDISQTRQTMMRNLAIHTVILGLLKDGLYVLEFVENKNEKNSIIIQLFECCYRFLLIFVKNDNKENKKCLFLEMEFFIRSIEYYEVGQTDLICEIFKNNYKLSIQVTDDILSNFYTKIITKGHDIKYLQFYKNIIFDKDEPIKSNIQKIVNFLFDSNRRYEFLYMIANPFFQKVNKNDNDSEGEEDPKAKWGHYIFDLDPNSKNKEDLPYVYHSEALLLLYDCLKYCEDKQLLKIVCQKTFSPIYFFYLLSLDDIYFEDTPIKVLRATLKNPLLKILDIIWLSDNKSIGQLIGNKNVVKFVKKQKDILKMLKRSDIEEIRKNRKMSHRISNIGMVKEVDEDESDDDDNDNEMEEDAEEIIINSEESLIKGIQRKEENINIHNALSILAAKQSERYSFDFMELLFDGILPSMINLMKTLLMSSSNLENIDDRRDLSSLFEYGKAFASFFKMNVSSVDWRKYRNYDKLLIEFEKFFDVTLEYPNYDNVDEEILDTDIYNKKHLLKNDGLPLSNIFPAIKKETIKYNKDHAWRVFLLNLLIDPYVKEKLILPERISLITAIKHIADLNYCEVVNEYLIKGGHKMSLEGFLKKLVNFFKVWSEDSNIEKDGVILNVIFLLQDLIEYSEDDDEKERMQNLLNKCNVTSTIMGYMSSAKVCNKIFGALVQLSVSLLDGGNGQVQNEIYDYFIKNSQSEQFFAHLNTLINKEINFINKPKSHYEKVDICLKEISYSYKLHSNFTMTNLLRLLQLFTENHNSNLQNYLRYQFNSRNNYDVLNLVVRFLEVSLKEYNEHNYHQTLQCFDTLTEFIQGPCEENQNALVESHFIKIASKLLLFNDSLSKAKQRAKRKYHFAKSFKKVKKNKNHVLESAETTLLGSQMVLNDSQNNEIEYQKILIKYIESFSPNFAKEIESTFEKYSPLGFQNHTWMISWLKYKCIITVESLCEGNNDSEIIRKIMKNLSLDVLKDNLGWLYEKKSKLYGEKYNMNLFNHFELDEKKVQNKEELTFIIETGFKIFFILRKYLEIVNSDDDEDYEDIIQLKKEFSNLALSENIVSQIGAFGLDLLKTGVNVVDKIGEITRFSKLLDKQNSEDLELNEDKQQKHNKLALEFFGKHTASIEINRNGKLYKLFFPKIPHCIHITKELKYEFQQNANRATLNSKVLSLVNLSENMINCLKIDTMIKSFVSKNAVLALLAKHLKLWKDVSFLVCILQNILIIVLSDVVFDGSHSFAFNKIVDANQENSLDSLDLLYILELLQIACSITVFIFSFSRRAPLVYKQAQKFLSKTNNMSNSSSIIIRLYNYPFRFYVYSKFLLLDIYIDYYMVYTALAILGLFNPIFIAALLLDVFVRFPLLLYVIKSLWRPKYQILLTLVLFIILQYYFTLVAYYVFYESFQDLCEDLYQCFSLIFDVNFKTNSGIGSFFTTRPEDYVGWYITPRSIYDFINYFIMVNLITEIIAGIIIDTFAILREELDERNEDIENFCFICGLDRHTLDKKTQEKKGFLYHVKVDHNMWNYIFYIAYLRDKIKTEYSGFESYIYDKLEDQDITWFPLNQSLSISKKVEENEEKTDILEENSEEIIEKHSEKETEKLANDILLRLEQLERDIELIENYAHNKILTH